MAFFHQSGHVDNVPFKLQNRWFTRFLFGVDNGVEKDPKAWIVREDARPSGASPHADYPNPEAAPVTLRLQKGGDSVGALAFEATAGQGKETIVDDPKQAGATLAQAASSPHRLLYALPKLTAPLHVSGTPRITVRLACDKPATNLSVWLVSLPWQGGRKITDDVVTRGWADPQNRNSLTKGEPLVPGTFYDVSFDLQPDDQILAVGEQLALMIMASDNEFTLHPKAGTKLTIDLDGTSLVVPVVGGEKALRQAVGK
jgi:X-Pro dipeptidyl-peptidase